MIDKESILYKKIYGCLLGGIIGDAMGAPTEDLTYEEIKEKFGYITDFEGAGTDDSAIKLILCEAILKHEGHVTADEFAEAFLNNKKTYYNLFFIPVKNMFHKIESGLELPVYAGLGNMQSSSSAMSISPLGIINACDPRQAAMEAYDVAGLIHGGVSTFCRDGACAIAAAVAQAMDPTSDVESIVEAATAYLHTLSSAEMIENVERVMEIAKRTETYEGFRKEFYEVCLRDIVSDSRETVPCALALFYLADGDPVKAIQYAANLGRDADTIGTMVGAIAGAYKGIDGLAVEWIEKVENSYKKQQKSSKEVQANAVMPDQRELAEAFAEVVRKRMDERRTSLSKMELLREKMQMSFS